MASKPLTIAAPAREVQNPAHSAEVIDLAAARRTLLLRRVWAEHDGEGRAI